ncbi:fidgetin-like protein 1 [Brachionichthys hirsutus]|uniref:fidgetin-like protein 1 n=1 Tax=Brachionichthys hirsutus TaxID=412623 RepID=UPI0036051318
MSSTHLDNWQRRSFDVSSGNCTPEQMANVNQSHLLSIQYAWANCQLSQAGMTGLFRTYSERYAAVLDLDDLRTGLNNHAESALHLVRSQRNYSHKWEASLTMEAVLDLPCIQKMIQEGTGGGRPLVEPGDSNISVGQGGRSGSLPTPCAGGGSAAVLLNSLGPPQVNAEVNARAECSRPQSAFHHPHAVLSQGNDGQAGAVHNYQSSSSTSNPSKRKNVFSPDGGNGGKGQHRVQAGADSPAGAHFRTAREQFIVDKQRKHPQNTQKPQGTCAGATLKRSLGANRPRGAFSKFVSPIPRQEEEDVETSRGSDLVCPTPDERLKNIEPKIIDLIMNEIMDHGTPVAWDDIAGLEFAKSTIKEIVVWPMLRPDIFTGLRGPPKGILLFGPPGTGKTLIGKCIACQSGATFFSISASSLTSKWVGEGEKMVRALFAIARCHQPAVIFIDEIDSLLSQRTDGEHDSSRRIKTEFLVQLDGAATAAEDRILVVGATNRPQEIDEAARRRLAKRLYIPLPEAAARSHIVTSLMAQVKNQLRDQELDSVVAATEGFSGADMTQLCKEAALGPIRSIQLGDISNITADQVRPILYKDFQEALKTVRPSVSSKDLELYEEWNKTFGCGS